MAELVVSTPEGQVLRYRLGPVTVIGRHPECDIVVTDPMSSRRHCKVEMAAPGVFFAEDNGSANGTFLNGELLRARTPMKPGDVIEIGSTKIVLKTEGHKATASKEAARPMSGAFDPGLSFVQLKEDVAEQDVNFEYSVAASNAAVLTDDEASSTDPRQIRKITQRLKLMVEMGMALGTTLEPDKLLDSILDKLFEAFAQSERGFILLFGPKGELPQGISSEQKVEGFTGPLSFAKTRNPSPGQENALSISRTVVNKVRAKRQSALMSDAEGDVGLSMARLEIRSVMCAPLVANNEDLGILYLDTKDRNHRFTQDDLSLVNAVAGQVAVVIKNAQLAQAAAAEAANRQSLQRFLAPQLVERVLKGQMKVELGGQYKTGTVFFSDIVGFTRMAGLMRPGDVVALLNRYFKVMVDIIFNRNGTVDKFGGDLIMAFWDVLVEVPSPEAAAVSAAIDMQNAMFTFNCDLAADEAIVKPPEPLGHGIGLNTGEFVAGNIGGDKKLEFTVIGNAVNLAQRMEALAGRGNVFVGQGTFEGIKERAFVVKLPDTYVRNVPHPIPVYSVRGIIPPGPISDGPGVGDTSRLAQGATDMVMSMPCKLTVAGQPEYDGLMVRMSCSRNEKRGRFQILTSKPLPRGAQAELVWNLNETQELLPLKGEVEVTWGEAPPPEGTPKPNYGTVVLHCVDLPEDILSIRPGVMTVSPLKSMDEIVRA